MMLDDLMPVFDVVERHEIAVRASADRVFAAIRTANLAPGIISRVLLALRAVPSLLMRTRWTRAARSEDQHTDRVVTLSQFERHGFRIVAERRSEELVIGLLGKFWTPTGGLCREVSRETFAAPPPDGFALAGWNFFIVSGADGTCTLHTETRVRSARDVRVQFLLYWAIIRAGSGLLRRAMLQSIKSEAEYAQSS